MEASGWDAVFAEMTGAGESAEAVTDTAPPEADAPLTAATDTPVVDSAPVAVDAAAPVEEAVAAEVPASEPDPEPAPVFNWRDDPEAQAALAKAEKLEAIERQLAEARRLQEAKALQDDLNELVDGDMERNQKLTGVLARLTTPLQHRAAEAESRLVQTEAALAAFIANARARFDDNEFSAFMAEANELRKAESGEEMERIALGRKESAAAVQRQLAEKDAQIQALQRQLAARAELEARAATGADAVDGGGGATADLDRDTRLQRATTNDEFFGALFAAA